MENQALTQLITTLYEIATGDSVEPKLAQDLHNIGLIERLAKFQDKVTASLTPKGDKLIRSHIQGLDVIEWSSEPFDYYNQEIEGYFFLKYSDIDSEGNPESNYCIAHLHPEPEEHFRVQLDQITFSGTKSHVHESSKILKFGSIKP